MNELFSTLSTEDLLRSRMRVFDVITTAWVPDFVETVSEEGDAAVSVPWMRVAFGIAAAKIPPVITNTIRRERLNFFIR